jgi:hypothetical protein
MTLADFVEKHVAPVRPERLSAAEAEDPPRMAFDANILAAAATKAAAARSTNTQHGDTNASNDNDRSSDPNSADRDSADTKPAELLSSSSSSAKLSSSSSSSAKLSSSSSSSARLAAGLAGMTASPRYFRTCRAASAPQLSVAPAGSGAPLHRHPPAWNRLFFGRKLWVAVPPGRETRVAEHLPPVAWAHGLGEGFMRARGDKVGCDHGVICMLRDGGEREPCFYLEYPVDGFYQFRFIPRGVLKKKRWAGRGVHARQGGQGRV